MRYRWTAAAQNQTEENDEVRLTTWFSKGTSAVWVWAHVVLEVITDTAMIGFSR